MLYATTGWQSRVCDSLTQQIVHHNMLYITGQLEPRVQ